MSPKQLDRSERQGNRQQGDDSTQDDVARMPVPHGRTTSGAMTSDGTRTANKSLLLSRHRAAEQRRGEQRHDLALTPCSAKDLPKR